MVLAGEGTSAQTASAYGGGVGGKVTRNNQSRRSRATPYDRPSTARRNPGLLSKLVVDPIRNLAASAAHRFFSSVTGKRLAPPPPPPPLPPESIQEVEDELGEAAPEHKAEEPLPLAIDGQSFPTTNNGGISELEQLLMQKSFTRSEIDHLTELLRSKALDLPVDNEVKRVEASPSEPTTNSEKQQQLLKSPLAENGTEREKYHGVISAPGISTRVLEENIASPAELAKAYMGTRPSKVSPSMLALRSKAVREEASLLSNVPFTPKSAMISLAPNTATRVEHAENSLPTTRFRGRSAIYNMARTPYSRALPTAFGKGNGPRRHAYDGYLLPSSTSQDQGEPGSTKLALKRRNSVLDDELGSVGPMRRIRQKHNLSSQRLNLPTTRGTGGISDAVQEPLSLMQNHTTLEDWKFKGLKMRGENVDNDAPSTSYAHVPPKSSQMAAKILEQLEKVTPKGKSAESKLAIARDKVPAKLTTDMLHGQALRSLDSVQSPKLLQSSQGGQTLGDKPQSSVAHVNDFLSRKERIEENGDKKLSGLGEISTPVLKSDTKTSVDDIVLSAETSDSAAKFASQRPQKKRAFVMSAHEESFDLDEETYSNGPTSDALVGWRGREKSTTDQSSASAGKVVQDTTASILPMRKKTPPEPIFGKQTDLEVRSATVSGENTGVAFPALQASSMTSPLFTHPPLTSAFEKPKQANDKVPATESSPVPSVTDLSSPKPSLWIQPSTENLSSSGTAVPSLEVPASDKHDGDKAQEAADVKGKPETTHSSPLNSQPVTRGFFIVPENSTLKNGPLAISPSADTSIPSLASTGHANQVVAAATSPISASPVTNFATATWSSSTSNTSPFASAVAPAFQFGSSASPSTAVSSSVSIATNSESLVVKTNTEKESNAGGLSNIPPAGTSFPMASNGSSGFGLSSSSASLTAKSQSDSAAAGFVFGIQSSNVGPGAATAPPFQFGTSASSPVFGSSGISSFTSSNPLFSSSAPAMKVFGSGATSGLSPSTSSVEIKSVDAGSGPSSGVFGIGSGASSGSSALSFSSGTSNMFTFAASSSATSSLTNTVGSSSSTPAIFGFGAMPLSGGSMISSGAGTPAGIFGASTSSPPETSATASSSATSVSFGSSWQTPNTSAFGAASSSSPSTVFSFSGASASSFTAANAAPMAFGSSSAALSGPVFSFSTVSSTPLLSSLPLASSSIFGNSTATFTAPGNNDQMSMEDTMAEDVQSTTPAVPVFGQQPVASPGSFVFGSAVPQSAPPFQFGGQPSQSAAQNPSPFQASGSLEFGAGGSFSLGSSGGQGDKSSRRIVKVSRTGRQRKR